MRFKFKGFLVLALMITISFAFTCSSVFAANARYGYRATSVQTDTDAVLGAGTWVYGVAINADSATNAWAAIYDSATYSHEGDLTGLKVDIGEPTQYETTYEWFTKPMYFSTGVSVAMGEASNNVGVVTIYYGPPPD